MGEIRDIKEVMEEDNPYTRYLARGGKPSKLLLELERRRPRGVKRKSRGPVRIVYPMSVEKQELAKKKRLEEEGGSKKKRGRPRKYPIIPQEVGTKRKRGRPRKSATNPQEDLEESSRAIRGNKGEWKKLKESVLRVVRDEMSKKVDEGCERMFRFSNRGMVRMEERYKKLKMCMIEMQEQLAQIRHPRFFDPTWKGKGVDVEEGEATGLDEEHAIVLEDDEEEEN